VLWVAGVGEGGVGALAFPFLLALEVYETGADQPRLGKSGGEGAGNCRVEGPWDEGRVEDGAGDGDGTGRVAIGGADLKQTWRWADGREGLGPAGFGSWKLSKKRSW
jgi:hypothetical protein